MELMNRTLNNLFIALLALLGGFTSYIALALYSSPGIPYAVAIGFIVLIGSLIVIGYSNQVDILLSMVIGAGSGVVYYISLKQVGAWSPNGIFAVVIGAVLFACMKHFHYEIRPALPEIAMALASALISIFLCVALFYAIQLIWICVIVFWFLNPTLYLALKFVFQADI
jgi:hypothetical protein